MAIDGDRAQTDVLGGGAGPAKGSYPFSALVGQESMKLALLLAAVAPELGGVLIQGERGTAKSTAVRALAGLLPPVPAAADCPLGCDPAEPFTFCPVCRGVPPAGGAPGLRPVRLVELPVGATEDRVLGHLDLEAAIGRGQARFSPGLLAQAHRGVLYVDEVNLLADHVVDVILDAAASGRSRVEREGLSVSHPARFLLVGTMNPAEGELRPQLLDRFGLAVTVEGFRDAALRAEVVRRRIAWERDPEAFAAAWAAEEEALAARLAAARRQLPAVAVGEDMLQRVVARGADSGAEGMRADLAIYRAARALAALEGRAAVSGEDVDRAAELALGHRRGSPDGGPPPMPQPERGPGRDRDSGRRPEPPDSGPGEAGRPEGPSEPPGSPGHRAGPEGQAPHASRASPDRVLPTLDPGRPLDLATPGTGSRPQPPRPARPPRPGRSGRSRPVPFPPGAWVGSRPWRGGPLALGPSLVAAVPLQRVRARLRGPAPGWAGAAPAVHLRPPDLRERVLAAPPQRLLLFLLDASGSMGVRRRMAAAKGAVVAAAERAYQTRDRVALMGFRGSGCDLLLPATRSVAQAGRCLEALPTGGRTPLQAGLDAALDYLRAHRRRSPGLAVLLTVFTDGRANAGPPGADPFGAALEAARRLARERVPALVVDTEAAAVRLGLAARLARAMGAPCASLDDFVARGWTSALAAAAGGRSGA